MTAARRIEGIRKEAIETGRNRLLVAGAVLTLAFAAVGARVVDLTVFKAGGEPRLARIDPLPQAPAGRADMLDRNGVILATSLPTASLYADPAAVLNHEEAADRLADVLPDLDRRDLLAKLRSRTRFQWISRNLTPNQQYRVNRLGLPGFGFQRGERRVYPHGRLVAHVLGLTDVDGYGIAGLEQYFDRTLRAGTRLRVALDLRVQAVLRDELMATVREFRAVGATGLVLDVDSGEVIALVSLPDFDPNDPKSATGEMAFNRATKGVYEMGSTFKLFTAAMALDSGTVDLRSSYDASKPIRVARFTITDFHAKNRWLTVPEIVVYSSNIGAAKMALDVGTDAQRAYLGRFGLLQAAAIELPEVGTPLMPDRWREINTMTIAYGHGIAVSPMQLASGVAALVNGGFYVPPTLLRRPGGNKAPGAQRVLSAETSETMRHLMRLVVSRGTGRQARAEGYAVGGKTGTADKLAARGYEKSATISSFVGAFPIDAPRYVVLVLVDEPKGNERTFNYATGGWVAAPAVGRVIKRMAALIGMPPRRHPGATPDDGLVREARLTTAGSGRPAPASDPPPSLAAPRLAAPGDASAESRVLRRVRAVLDADGPEAGAAGTGAGPAKETNGTIAAGPPEQALATH
ncbi:MAG: peptidoglycan D,D-transpeptidase FtsI family protein [Rhodospirillales bacterium]